jgi:hypothetical protein
MGPTYIVKNRITLSSVISIAIVAIFLMYISLKISSAFANVNQPIFSLAPNQILKKITRINKPGECNGNRWNRCFT